MAKVTRELKERLISYLERNDISSFFRLLSEYDIDEPIASQLKQEYLVGKINSLYIQRLMFFARNLDESDKPRIILNNTDNIKLIAYAIYVVLGTIVFFYVLYPLINYATYKEPNKGTVNSKTKVDSLYKIIEKQNDLINKYIKDNRMNKDTSISFFDRFPKNIEHRYSEPTVYDYLVYGVTGLSILLAISGFYVAQRSRKKVKELEENYNGTESITDNEKEKIVEQTAIKVVDTLNNQPRILKEDEKSNIIEELFSKITSQTAQDIKRKERFETINRTIDYSKSRLVGEIQALNKKATFNVGIALSVVFISIFLISISFLYFSEAPKELVHFLYYFIPRLSLLVFTQLLANYFLSLYRTNSNEIKYYQNELTDLEYKSISLKIALLSENEENVEYLLKEVMKTERNKVLKDGETTVELEMHKADNSFYKDLNPNQILQILLQSVQKEEKEKERKDGKEEEKT